MISKAFRMNVATALSVFVIFLLTVSGAKIEAIIGFIGAGLVFVTGWGLGFLVEIFEGQGQSRKERKIKK